MKNPWMSLWMSAAAKNVGTAQGYWMNEVKKQQTLMQKQMAKAVTDEWLKAWGMAPKKK